MSETQSSQLSEQTKAREVAKAAELQHVRLRGCVVRQRLRDGTLPETVVLGDAAQVATDSQSKFLFVDVELTLRARYRDMPADVRSEDAALFIGATYQLVYSLTSAANLDKRHLIAFGEQTGLVNVWPYWREFVSSMTNRMELPTFNIPLLKLVSAMERVLTRVLQRGLWNTAMPISQLRDTLKNVDPLVIQESANAPEVIDQLLDLSDDDFSYLIDRLDLAKRFPDAKP